MSIAFQEVYELGIARTGLEGLWHFQETAADPTAYDSSGNALNGTYNGPTLGTAGALGDGTFGATFDGVDDDVSVAYQSADAGPWSIAAWVKPAAAGAGSWRTIFNNGATGVHIAINDTNEWTYGRADGSGFFHTGSEVTNDEWSYVVLTYDGTSLRLYVNGALDAGPHAPTGTWANGATVYWGSYNGASEFFNGVLDAVAVYSTAIEAAVITRDYARFSTPDWTDVTEDTRVMATGSRGMSGGSPLDRVARTGTADVVMNNYPRSNRALVGYYMPGHTNCLSGFRLGITWRLRIVYEELNRPLFTGTIQSVTPEAGEHRGQSVDIQVVDWMDEAATHLIEIATQTDKRSDEIFEAVLDASPVQPRGKQVDTGMDTYPYALDTARAESTTAMNEFAKIAMSELGYIYVKGDGTVVFESRADRGAASPTNLFTFDETMYELEAVHSRGDIINQVKTTIHPRRVDTVAVVLYEIVQPIELAAGATVRPFGPYSDPESRASRVGAASTEALVAGTDYVANSAADGSGTNLTANISVTANATGSGVSFVVTNNGSQTAYITTLQIRGLGLYDFENIVMEAEDTDSQDLYGTRAHNFDMPYQDDPVVGESAARYLVALHKDAVTSPRSISYVASKSDTLMRQALLREISDRIGVVESMTGLTEETSDGISRGYFINGVRFELNGAELRMSYVLTPADRNAYWLLSVVGHSELSETTRLGYGIFQGHADVAHADTAHEDTAHGDTEHADVEHADDGHGDSAHSDVAHADVAHSDQAFDNGHGDSPHGDTAHGDGYTLVHDDGAFGQWYSHNDTAHEDAVHIDRHGDIPHGDTLHSDVTHGDASHDDNAHGDVTHEDVSHDDVEHDDTAHGDSEHGDQFG